MKETIKSKKDDDESKTPEGLDKLANIFPEIYYDFIARVVPGMIVFLFSLWLSTKNPHNLDYNNILQKIQSTTWSHVGIIAFGGYVIGFLSIKIWDIMVVILYFIYHILNFILKDKLNKLCNWIKENIDKNIVDTYLISLIKLDETINGQERKSSENQVLIKILAELAFFQNLFIGWLAINIIYKPDKQAILTVNIFSHPYHIGIFFLLCILHHFGVLTSRINSFKRLHFARHKRPNFWRCL
ncbi:hypothetical protein A1507_22640 [Methylomonas koyamae]|uniref:Uncharacterized protein n=1 Tax=Methylomonas koyamae TaxID=702114 RepID=A0A177NRN9_9GAMM|nr:hypothetical protein [Methylomonas koyamae]OAI20738.1 hypothetical protein A1507_22640 [Methylomonas koyamae]